MSIEHSQKLIKEIADRREADDYFEGLLKDPAMRADMERAEREPQTTPDPPPVDLEAIAKEHLRQYYAQQQEGTDLEP